VTKFSLFWILWMVTGNPLVAIVVLVLAFALLDRFALGLTPPWIKAWLRPGQASRLQAQVNANPHDKPARRALAELLVARRRYARAVSIIEPVVAESARPESGALLIAAEAYLGHGNLERAGACIEAAHAGARTNQYFALALLTGRILEGSGRLLEAQEAYAEAVSLSQGRVEPRYRLYRVLKRIERLEDAEKARRGAWQAYVEAPFFQQRQERLWAWRANPARPAMYAAVLCGVGIVLSSLRF
jgi:tetratricopeptide (TPR) repeat protein